MKKIYFTASLFILLSACGGDSKMENNQTLTTDINDTEEFAQAASSFSNGAASNPEEYFSGLLAVVVEVDLKFREIIRLDEEDESKSQITSVIDGMVSKIQAGRKSINIYNDKDWALRSVFHDLTIEWFASLENMANDYLYMLADPMSRPDDTWTEEELSLYEDYALAQDSYYEIDQRWIAFQYTFAEMHNFDPGEEIDLETIVEEEANQN